VASQQSVEFNLASTYIQLFDGSDAALVPVDPEFWSRIADRTELHQGRLVMVLHQARGPWAGSEMHPAGDEVLYLLSGAMELLLDGKDGERKISLRPGTAFIVPRGVWHTANIISEGDLLTITRGAGTQHRARQ
jgi:mannose-6-phosphate isomerase-like protein (cupin superfamily)